MKKIIKSIRKSLGVESAVNLTTMSKMKMNMMICMKMKVIMEKKQKKLSSEEVDMQAGAMDSPSLI